MSRGPLSLPGTANQVRGERNRDAGEAFEAWLEGWHRRARQLGIARVRKVSPAVKWVGRGHRARPKVVGENGADYVGRLRGGRAIVAEAKATEEERLPRSAFEKHQIDDLDEAAALGALALGLIELRIAGRVRRFAAPWPLDWRWRGAGASVGLEELEPWEIRDGECYLARWAR